MAEHGYMLTEGQMKAIRETVRKVITTHGGAVVNEAPQQGVNRPLAVVLNANLAAATNSKTGATSGLARVLTWSTTTSRYTESLPAAQITVYNHSESTAHAINTFGKAERIDGHWWFFGDCDAMKTRGTV